MKRAVTEEMIYHSVSLALTWSLYMKLYLFWSRTPRGSEQQLCPKFSLRGDCRLRRVWVLGGLDVSVP